MASSPRARVILEAERRGAAAFKSFQADLKKVGIAAGVAAAAAGSALAVVTKRAFEQIDALAKTSDLLGVNTKAMASLQFAGQLTGNSLEKVNLGMQRMTRRVAEAAEGMGEARGALTELGLDAQELARLPLEQQFERVSQALTNVEDASARVRLGFKLFDSEGVALLRTARLVANEGLAGITTEAERMGIAMSRVDAAKIEQANDAVLRARSAVQGVGNVIAVQLAPIVTTLANRFADVGSSAASMGRVVGTAIEGIATGIGVAADVTRVWQEMLLRIETTWLRVAAAAKTPSRLMGEAVPEAAEEAQRLALQSVIALRALQEAEMPSALIASNLAKARVEAQKAAEETARLAETAIAVPGLVGGGETSAAEQQAAEAAAREQERLQASLERVQEFLLTREQQEVLASQRRAEILRTAFEQELIDKERFNELSVGLAERLQMRLTEIAESGSATRTRVEQAAARAQTTTALGLATALAQVADSGSKRAFQINKSARIAQAVMNTHAAVTKALAEGPPWPGNILAAAAAAAQGLAEVSAIRSTSLGGGGSGGFSAAGGALPAPLPAPAPPAAPSQDQGREVVIQVNVQGSMIGAGSSHDLARELAELLRDVVDTNDVLLFDSNSRQALEILEAAR